MKTYSDTDIPDDLMNRAAYLITIGEVRAADMESPQRLVARGMMLEREDQLKRAIEDLPPPDGTRH